jgi:hypothetical protein
MQVDPRTRRLAEMAASPLAIGRCNRRDPWRTSRSKHAPTAWRSNQQKQHNKTPGGDICACASVSNARTLADISRMDTAASFARAAANTIEGGETFIAEMPCLYYCLDEHTEGCHCVTAAATAATQAAWACVAIDAMSLPAVPLQRDCCTMIPGLHRRANCTRLSSALQHDP